MARASSDSTPKSSGAGADRQPLLRDDHLGAVGGDVAEELLDGGTLPGKNTAVLVSSRPRAREVGGAGLLLGLEVREGVVALVLRHDLGADRRAGSVDGGEPGGQVLRR